jgi:hypothetical protein
MVVADVLRVVTMIVILFTLLADVGEDVATVIYGVVVDIPLLKSRPQLSFVSCPETAVGLTLRHCSAVKRYIRRVRPGRRRVCRDAPGHVIVMPSLLYSAGDLYRDLQNVVRLLIVWSVHKDDESYVLHC